MYIYYTCVIASTNTRNICVYFLNNNELLKIFLFFFFFSACVCRPQKRKNGL